MHGCVHMVYVYLHVRAHGQAGHDWGTFLTCGMQVMHVDRWYLTKWWSPWEDLKVRKEQHRHGKAHPKVPEFSEGSVEGSSATGNGVKQEGVSGPLDGQVGEGPSTGGEGAVGNGNGNGGEATKEKATGSSSGRGKKASKKDLNKLVAACIGTHKEPAEVTEAVLAWAPGKVPGDVACSHCMSYTHVHSLVWGRASFLHAPPRGPITPLSRLPCRSRSALYCWVT